jgi:nitrate reductase (NAD(P)H)
MTNGHESEYQKLLKKYTPQEITLLRHLQHEASQTQRFQQNPGTFLSPLSHSSRPIDTSIDGADAQTPDNWISRSPHLIRRTGQHPLNAEAELSTLFDAGLITPNDLHYVRNHGSVPRLYWEEHVLDVCNGALKIEMDDLRSERWESINIPVALACDGNRRGELNLVRKSKGFDWGPGAAGCAYWRGVRVCDVLRSIGVTVEGRKWVNFEGADDPSEGKYATCFPLEFIMDPCNDVLLAYEMNDQPLPPDHGFPVRLVVPGYVGGRSVKWLARIWISDQENDSYYHIW